MVFNEDSPRELSHSFVIANMVILVFADEILYYHGNDLDYLIVFELEF